MSKEKPDSVAEDVPVEKEELSAKRYPEPQRLGGRYNRKATRDRRDKSQTLEETFSTFEKTFSMAVKFEDDV